MAKYTNALYPDKINDLIDNNGNVNADKVAAKGVEFITTAPTSDNTDGTIKFVKLDEEPAERFNGYYYLIGNGEGGGVISDIPMYYDIIAIDLGANVGIKTFIVNKKDANNQYIATVIATESIDYTSWMAIPEEFTDGESYFGYDTELLNSYYASLSDKVKAALIDKDITRSCYYFNKTVSGYPTYYVKPQDVPFSSKKALTKKSDATLAVAQQKVYIPSIEDITSFTFAGDTAIGDSIRTTYFGNKVNQAKIWLNSADADGNGVGYVFNSQSGYIEPCTDAEFAEIRPMFTIDLSKVDYFFIDHRDEATNNSGNEQPTVPVIGPTVPIIGPLNPNSGL